MIGKMAKIPFSKIERTGIYINTSRKTLAQIKAEQGADYACNAVIFNDDFTAAEWLIVDGVVQGKPPWTVYGYNLDSGIPQLAISSEKYKNFMAATPLLVKDGKINDFKTQSWASGDRGRTTIGVTADALIMRCIPDLAGTADYTLDELAEDMLAQGCASAINFDGGGSSQCDFDGDKVTSSRTVHSIFLVWLKKNDGKMPTVKDYNQFVEGNNEPIYYSQKDPRWKNIMFSATGDKSQTVGTSGCGPTSLAMAIAQFADSTVTPVTMAARIVKGGWRTPNHGTEWACFAPICKEYGLTCVQTYSHVTAVECAAGGGLVICSMGSGLWTSTGHYILLWKVDGGTVYINDPNSTTSAKSKAALATLQTQRKVYFCVAAPKKNAKEENVIPTVKAYNQFVEGGTKLSTNFTVREFACNDGSGALLIADELVTLLQKIREHFGKAVTVNSGYRNNAYNKSIGGATASQHLQGTAADIVTSGITPRAVAEYADSLGAGGVGLYEYPGGFTHVDVRPGKSRWLQTSKNGSATTVTGF